MLLNTTQIVAIVRIIILTVGSFLLGRGLVTQVQLDAVTDVSTLTTIITALITLGTAIWGIVAKRDTALIADAGKALEGQGAIIAPPAIAGSSTTPANVVSTVAEARRIVEGAV